MDKGTVIFTDRFAETARGNSQWWQHVPIRKLVETTRYAIFTQAYSRVTFLCEPCPALLTTSRSSLACLKKAQRLSRISRCRYHRQAATYLASKIECYAMNAWLRKCTQDLLVWSDHMRFGKLRVKQIPSDSSVITHSIVFWCHLSAGWRQLSTKKKSPLIGNDLFYNVLQVSSQVALHKDLHSGRDIFTDFKQFIYSVDIEIYTEFSCQPFFRNCFSIKCCCLLEFFRRDECHYY